MERNLHQRVEVAFPILAPAIRQRVRAELDLPWEDGMRAWDMQPDGEYLLTSPNEEGKWRDPQKRLLKLTRK
jgi:polyphosphate kinase